MSKIITLGRGNLIFLGIFLTLVFLRPDLIFGDMSLGWHLLTGNYILNTGTIPHTDIISYTHAGKPWLPYEWLSGLIMAGVVRVAGMSGLLVITAAVIAASFLLLYERCAKENFETVALLLTCCGAVTTAGFWSARPYVFTYPLLIVLIACLEKFRQGRLSFPRICLILPIVMVLWTNLHPSFPIGLAIIAVYLISELLEAVFVPTVERGGKVKQSKRLVALLGICSVCTLINPFGYKLHIYIMHLSTIWLEGAKLIGELEVYPMFFTSELTDTGFEILAALGILGLTFSSSKRVLCQIVLFLLLGHMSFAMARALPVFVFVNLPFIAEWLAGIPEVSTQEVAWPLSKLLDWWKKVTVDTKKSSYRLLPVLSVSLLLMTATAQNSTHAVTVIKARFDPLKLPTRTAYYVVSHNLPEREGFNMYEWGGYLRWVYGLHVFIDDSNEFFEPPNYATYSRILQTTPGWEQALVDNHISWVLCNKKCNLAIALKENVPNWKLACEDPASMLFIRTNKQP